MERKKLLKSKEYWLAEIQLNLFKLIENYKTANKLNSTQLAQKLGVTKGYISQILNGNFDHKISKLVELSLAFNKVPTIEYKDLEKTIIEDELDALSKSWSYDLKQHIILNYKEIGYKEITKNLLNPPTTLRTCSTLSDMLENIGKKTVPSKQNSYEE